MAGISLLYFSRMTRVTTLGPCTPNDQSIATSGTTDPTVRTGNEQDPLFYHPCRIDTRSIAALFGSTCCSTRHSGIAAASLPDPAPALSRRCPASTRADAQAGLRSTGSGREGRIASTHQRHIRGRLSASAHSLADRFVVRIYIE